jgi:ankyrin repeat protein
MHTWIKNSIFLGTILWTGIACYGQELTNEIAWNIKYGNTEQLEKLISPESVNGCFKVADSKKYSYLAMSIKLKSMKSLQYFIEKGADIEGVCADKTPLMYAAKYGQFEMVKYLIEKGADPKKAYRGDTALDFAIKYRHPNIKNYLKAQSGP